MSSQSDHDEAKLKDRILGSILGIFIGDALGVGVHWQYDLDVLEKTRGFVTDYLDPLPGTFHSGTSDAPGRGKLQAGQLEQQGAIDLILLKSLAQNKQYDQDDFLERFEHIILRDPTMDGTRQGGRHGWTDKSVCDIYQCRIIEDRPWPECASPRSDTPDSIVRAALIGALYFQTPYELSVQVQRHAMAATLDSSVQAHSVAFASMVASAIQGVRLDSSMKDFLYEQPGRSLPFTSMKAPLDDDESYGRFAEPDSLLWFGSIAAAVKEFQNTIEPAHRGVLLYGQFCAFFATLPSAYYCVARFPEDFEAAVLCSVNGGGQNTMRTSLVGALLGAHVGLSGIPDRFVRGLADSKEILALANMVAQVALDGNQNISSTDVWYWPESKQSFDAVAIAKEGRKHQNIPAFSSRNRLESALETFPSSMATKNTLLRTRNVAPLLAFAALACWTITLFRQRRRSMYRPIITRIVS